MQIAIKTVNAKGLEEIRAFLEESSNIKNPGADQLAAFAEDAEFQMGEGNTPTIELRPYQSLTGRVVDFTISAEGISSRLEEIEE